MPRYPKKGLWVNHPLQDEDVITALEQGTGVEELAMSPLLGISVVEDPKDRGWWVVIEDLGVEPRAIMFETRELARRVAQDQLSQRTVLPSADPESSGRGGAVGPSGKIPRMSFSELERRARQN